MDGIYFLKMFMIEETPICFIYHIIIIIICKSWQYNSDQEDR